MRAFFAILVLVVTAYVALPLAMASAAPARPPDYVVVVNPANGVTHASRKFVGAAFLKKTTRWPNGEVIRPVDQAADAEVRRRFTEDVLNRSVAAVRSYWQQLLFAGRDLPPPELGSNEEIVSFVAKHEGAIGYVGGNAKLSGVKALTLE
jgi:ABC-type phosphate transport system substrate-binding protein